MSIRSLADFVEKLDAAGELCRVPVEVSTDQQLAELARRAAHQQGPALVFQKTVKSSVTLATNLLTTDRRIAIALGADNLDAAASRLPGANQAAGGGGWLDWLKAGFQAGTDAFSPRAVRTAACQQVVRLGRDVDLTELPALNLSSHDVHPSLFGACVVSGVDGAQRALGQFDLPVLDQGRLAIRWGPRDSIAAQMAQCRATGQKLSIAALLGTAPALTLTAAATVREPQFDPYLLAGLLGGEPTDVATCRTIAIQVPAEADLVIEGTIDPHAPPLADVTAGGCGGFGLLPSEAFEIQVSALTQRSNPIVSAAIPHAPPNEFSAVAQAMTRLWLPATRRTIPSLVDVDLPMTAIAGQVAVLSIKKEQPGQASQVAAAWWGQQATATTKMIIVVDAEVDVRNLAAVLSEVAAQADPLRDVLSFDGPIDHRDFTTPSNGMSRRVAIDATRKLPGERSGGWPSRFTALENVQREVDAIWASLELD